MRGKSLRDDGRVCNRLRMKRAPLLQRVLGLVQPSVASNGQYSIARRSHWNTVNICTHPNAEGELSEPFDQRSWDQIDQRLLLTSFHGHPTTKSSNSKGPVPSAYYRKGKRWEDIDPTESL